MSPLFKNGYKFARAIHLFPPSGLQCPMIEFGAQSPSSGIWSAFPGKIDSGADYTVFNETTFCKLQLSSAKPKKKTKIYTATGQEVRVKVYLVQVRFKDTFGVFHPLFLDVAYNKKFKRNLIGVHILQMYSIVWDIKKTTLLCDDSHIKVPVSTGP